MKVSFDLTNTVVKVTEWISRTATLNLLFLLFSLPILTLVPAFTALCYVTYHWQQEGAETVPVWQTFTGFFKQRFWQSYLFHFPYLLLAFFAVADLLFLSQYASPLARIGTYAIVTVALLGAAVYCYSLPLYFRELSVPVYKRQLGALLAALQRPFHTLLLMGAVFLLTAVSLIWPVGFIFFFFSLVGLSMMKLTSAGLELVFPLPQDDEETDISVHR